MRAEGVGDDRLDGIGMGDRHHYAAGVAVPELLDVVHERRDGRQQLAEAVEREASLVLPSFFVSTSSTAVIAVDPVLAILSRFLLDAHTQAGVEVRLGDTSLRHRPPEDIARSGVAAGTVVAPSARVFWAHALVLTSVGLASPECHN